jgi:2-methylisocitrate lyase-like PEP mutase family enzyme/predicted alpha/beta hydrolase family esterase
MTRILILPGLYDSGAAHWQSVWERSDPRCVRVVQRDWAAPVRSEWVATLDAAVGAARADGDDVVLVGHSSACSLVAAWAQSSARADGVRGALLVAPSDTEGPNYPTGPTGWQPMPLAPLPFPSIVVASTDDMYCTPARARQFAVAWQSKFVDMGPAGHINGESGLGAWPAGRALLDELLIDPRRRRFRQLHESGCFVIPNPWDVGTARFLASLGFPALATTSSGYAWSLGRADNHVPLDETLAHMRTIAAAVDVPINADFEGGFAIAPSDVAANVSAATGTGVAGLSIEDSTGDPAAPLFDATLAVERVVAARRAIDDSRTGVLLVARSEGFVAGRPDLAETVRRLTAFADAGADCLYAPGIRTREEIRAVVAAVAPKPVNVLVSSGFTTLTELAALGVRRISIGGALARVGWTGVISAAREIAAQGTFTGLGHAVSHDELDQLFGA